MTVVVKIPQAERVNLNLSSDLDPEGEAYIYARQATQREVEMRSSSFGKVTHVFKASGEREMVSESNYEAQRGYEVYLTLADCNLVIPKIDKPDASNPENFKPLFRFQNDVNGKSRISMSRDEFNEAWGILPEEVADAIHNGILKVNPQWDPNFRSE